MHNVVCVHNFICVHNIICVYNEICIHYVICIHNVVLVHNVICALLSVYIIILRWDEDLYKDKDGNEHQNECELVWEVGILGLKSWLTFLEIHKTPLFLEVGNIKRPYFYKLKTPNTSIYRSWKPKKPLFL